MAVLTRSSDLSARCRDPRSRSTAGNSARCRRTPRRSRVGAGSFITSGSRFEHAMQTRSNLLAGRCRMRRRRHASRRRRRSDIVQLISRFEISSPFGTITSEPLKVRSWLARRPMWVTLPSRSPNLDGVADLHRAFEDQDETRHEIVDDVLQAEADADAERTDDQREIRQSRCRGCPRPISTPISTIT